MKISAKYSAIAGIICYVFTGCAHQPVKSDQPAPHNVEHKPATPPTKKSVQVTPKKASPQGIAGAQAGNETPMGIVGGNGPVITDATLEAGPQAGKKDYAGTDEGIRQFRADYEKAGDKLSFLLAHVNEPQDAIVAQVAELLSRFDDSKSIAALKLLEHHHAREDSSVSVAQSAGESLQWLAAAHDMAKVQPGMSATELEDLIVKYRSNDIAYKYLYSAMKQEYEKDPAKYVPLFIEHYAHTKLAPELVKNYPEFADRGLDKCLAGTNADNVGSCMELIGETGNKKYLDKINDIAFFNKGNIDYINLQAAYNVRDHAFSAYTYMKEGALLYLEKVLYSQYDEAKMRAVSILVAYRELYGRNNVIAILGKSCQFMTTLQQRNQVVFDDVCKTMKAIEQEKK